MEKLIIQTILIVAFIGIGSLLLNWQYRHSLEKLKLDLNKEQLIEIKRIAFSTVSIIVGISYFIYLVLLR